MAETDETYSAKQIANRIGTDAKTFRKWLRSPHSPYKAVGQGQRYEFPKSDLRKISKEFHAWKDRAGKKLAPINGKPRKELPESQKISTPSRPIPRIDSGPDTRPDNPKKQFKAEVEARGAARDEEYGTVDGDEPTDHEKWLKTQDTSTWDDDDDRWIDASPSFSGEPTDQELDELEELDLDLSDLEND